MRRTLLVVFCAVVGAAALSARAQVAPAATKSGLSLSAGALGSVFQPDYAGQVDENGVGLAQTAPNRLYGVGAYFDLRFNRWVTIEGEANWLHWNQYLGINENTYQIGPKVPIHTFHGWTPYGKVLVGLGNGSFISGTAGTLSFGGGVDYRLTRKLTLRVADVEYQRWSMTPTLWPYGGSVGISYKIF